MRLVSVMPAAPVSPQTGALRVQEATNSALAVTSIQGVAKTASGEQHPATQPPRYASPPVRLTEVAGVELDHIPFTGDADILSDDLPQHTVQSAAAQSEKAAPQMASQLQSAPMTTVALRIADPRAAHGHDVPRAIAETRAVKRELAVPQITSAVAQSSVQNIANSAYAVVRGLNAAPQTGAMSVDRILGMIGQNVSAHRPTVPNTTNIPTTPRQ